mgnify:CR=1 FL=1
MEHISITIREMGYHLEEFERTGDIMSYQNNYEIQIKEAEEQVLVTPEKQDVSGGIRHILREDIMKDCQGTHDHKRSGNGHLP